MVSQPEESSRKLEIKLTTNIKDANEIDIKQSEIFQTVSEKLKSALNKELTAEVEQSMQGIPIMAAHASGGHNSWSSEG